MKPMKMTKMKGHKSSSKNNKFNPAKAPNIALNNMPVAIQDNDRKMAKISRAANAKKTITFNYIDKHGQPSVREVEPYEVKGNLLYAYCTNKQGIRVFNVNNISNVKRTENIFTPRWDIKL